MSAQMARVESFKAYKAIMRACAVQPHSLLDFTQGRGGAVCSLHWSPLFGADPSKAGAVPSVAFYVCYLDRTLWRPKPLTAEELEAKSLVSLGSCATRKTWKSLRCYNLHIGRPLSGRLGALAHLQQLSPCPGQLMFADNGFSCHTQCYMGCEALFSRAGAPLGPGLALEAQRVVSRTKQKPFCQLCTAWGSLCCLANARAFAPTGSQSINQSCQLCQVLYTSCSEECAQISFAGGG